MTDRKNLRTRPGSWILFDITAQIDCTSIQPNIYISVEEYMNENLIESVNFRILILNCRGGEINRKNNTRCNSTK